MFIITPNLHFKGQCEEAIALYKKAFHAQVELLERYSDADQKDWNITLTETQKNYIYHATMYIGNQRIMLNDTITDEPVNGTALSLVVTFEDAEGVKTAYEIMKQGAITLRPMKHTTYSSCFVSLIDRFGFRWELMTEQTVK